MTFKEEKKKNANEMTSRGGEQYLFRGSFCVEEEKDVLIRENRLYDLTRLSNIINIL